MNPFEINGWQITNNLLSQLDSFIVTIVFCTLHRESSQNKTLSVICDFLRREINFESQLDVF
jgi:hypothetical protein